MSDQTDNTRLEGQEPVQEPEQEPVQEPEAPAAPEKAPISDKKRTALLRYMAVLFGVAFLLVLLSFLIQIRDSRETISDLNKSNASALQNAVQLQEQNQTLTAAKEELELQLEEAEADLEEAMQETEDVRTQLEETQKQSDENYQLATDETHLRLGYDLLFVAQEMYANGEYEDCMDILEGEITEGTLEKFQPAARSAYDRLLEDCRAALGIPEE